MMWLKRLFHILMYSFFIIVPLVPIKLKNAFFPIASDSLIGGLAIVIGLAYLIYDYKNTKDEIKSLFKDKHFKILSIFILSFIILGTISITYSFSKKAAISEVLRFLEYVIIFYLIMIIADKDFVRRGFTVIYCTMIFAAIFGIFQFAFDFSSFYSPSVPLHRGRVYSTFVNPNYWGAAVNMIIFYPIIESIEDEDRKLNISIALLFLVNLVLTFTRGSWMGFVVGIIVLSIVKYRKMLFVIPAGALAAYAMPITRNRFLSIFNFSADTNRERLTLWKTGYTMFKANKVRGWGLGNYQVYYKSFVDSYHELRLTNENLTSTHNSYIKIMAELGILGIVSFLGVYLSLAHLTYVVYKNSKTKYKNIALAGLGFWGAYLFQNFFNNLMFIPQLNVFVWILTALLYKGYLLENEEVTNE